MPFAQIRRNPYPTDTSLQTGMGRWACGLLDHLALPECTMMSLDGDFTSATHKSDGFHARIDPSSIDHLPVGSQKWWRCRVRASSQVRTVTSDSSATTLTKTSMPTSSPHSPQSLSRRSGSSGLDREENSILDTVDKPWKQTTARVSGAFTMLSQVEDLTIVSCETKPIFTTLGTTVDGGILLPRLRTLTVYVGNGVLDVSTLNQCAKARKEHSMLYGPLCRAGGGIP